MELLVYQDSMNHLKTLIVLPAHLLLNYVHPQLTSKLVLMAIILLQFKEILFNVILVLLQIILLLVIIQLMLYHVGQDSQYKM